MNGLTPPAVAPLGIPRAVAARASRTAFADARTRVAAFLVAGGAEDKLGEAVWRGNVGSA